MLRPIIAAAALLGLAGCYGYDTYDPYYGSYGAYGSGAVVYETPPTYYGPAYRAGPTYYPPAYYGSPRDRRDYDNDRGPNRPPPPRPVVRNDPPPRPAPPPRGAGVSQDERDAARFNRQRQGPMPGE